MGLRYRFDRRSNPKSKCQNPNKIPACRQARQNPNDKLTPRVLLSFVIVGSNFHAKLVSVKINQKHSNDRHMQSISTTMVKREKIVLAAILG